MEHEQIKLHLSCIYLNEMTECKHSRKVHLITGLTNRDCAIVTSSRSRRAILTFSAVRCSRKKVYRKNETGLRREKKDRLLGCTDD